MKIDIVVSWLDSSDLNWQKEFSKQVKGENIELDSEKENNEARFRDYETFKYWFRGIEKYAPWVNNIFLVTWGHLPEWLNVSHPKLNIVKHSDFIPLEYLPTFSSDTIALNLHRIKGLSEHFIYFNDDMFLINPTKENDFFEKQLPKDVLVLYPAPTLEAFDHFAINNMSVIHRKFSKKEIIKQNLSKILTPRLGIKLLAYNILMLPFPFISYLYPTHLATPLLKTTYEKLWQSCYKEFDMCSRHKFRNITDVNDWIIRLYQIVSGEFVPYHVSRFGKYYNINQITSFDDILNSKLKEVCFNDSPNLLTKEFIQIKEQMIKSFSKKFPTKSSFEN